MLVLHLAIAALASSPQAPQYFTPSGPVGLVPATDLVVVEVQSPALMKTVLGGAGAVRETHLFGRYQLIEGAEDPRGLEQSLVASGAVQRVLTGYRSESHGRVLIADGKVRARFAKDLTNDEIMRRIRLAGGIGARVLRPDRDLWEVIAPSSRDAVEVARRLHEPHHAIWAHPDFITRRQHNLVPNDPIFDDQWHHELIGSEGAWEMTLGSPAVIIAIIDSGLDLDHPEFADKIVAPWDSLEEDLDPTPDPTDAHGTSTAGIATAAINNSLGGSGVCPGCSVMPIRILSESGWGREGSDVDAFYWAVDHGAQILSNSWGPYGPAEIPYDMQEAIDYVADESREGKGALILFASGNEYRENEGYELASYPSVIGVGATTYYDAKEDYSNWGAELDITAPAVSVTTDMLGDLGYDDGDYTYDFGGTSAACPTAAGVAGIILSLDPLLDRAQVTAAMLQTADKIDTDDVTYDAGGFNQYYGYGRVNAYRAAQKVSTGEVCQPVPEICDNGVDDDCDFVVDGLDVSCAPDYTEIGIACDLDFHCGSEGFCLSEDYGYPDGYCSAGCTDSCPGEGTVCVQFEDGGMCYDGCDKADDCRQDYDCLPVSEDSEVMVCQPSCKFLGCREGETCDETTGNCWHDGPVEPGGACNRSLECADDGRCLREEWTGLPDGFCNVGCDTDEDCAAGTHCQDFGDGWMMCAQNCQREDDCRNGYTCWPTESETEGLTLGVCWWACTRHSDCGEDVKCNEYGLCGDETPPVVDPEVEEEPSQSEVCACDATTACEQACECDTDCRVKEERDGCAAGSPSIFLALVGLFGLARRRRVG